MLRLESLVRHTNGWLPLKFILFFLDFRMNLCHYQALRVQLFSNGKDVADIVFRNTLFEV